MIGNRMGNRPRISCRVSYVNLGWEVGTRNTHVVDRPAETQEGRKVAETVDRHPLLVLGLAGELPVGNDTGLVRLGDEATLVPLHEGVRGRHARGREGHGRVIHDVGVQVDGTEARQALVEHVL